MKQMNWRKLLYLGVLLISLFLIFFFGKEVNKETGKNKRVIVPNGIEYFKKGLDVAGWTRLVYTIDYSQYKEVYKDPAQFQEIKRNIETIIKRNIDSRIDKLWVSDYNAYYQTAWDAFYLVVEIGGIADLDQAKNTIGKTLELEFKLPSKEDPSPESLLQRKKLAKIVLNQVLDQEDNFKEITDERASENIFYWSYSGVALSQLPEIYQNNSDILKNMEINKIYPWLLEWNYTIIPGQTAEDKPTELKWFTFFRILERKTIEKTDLTSQDIISIANQYNLENSVQLVKNPDILEWKYKYDKKNKTLTYFASTTNKEDAVKLEIYDVPKADLLWLSDEEVQTENTIFDNTVEKVKSAISANKDPLSISGVSFVMKEWTDVATCGLSKQ